nr:bifunctional uroporphyrinogen-III C-methyltransferase/uroporphyrinogen-III synthase [Longispora sp. (in: high G+C Gram-positive bacteria)]
MTRTRKSVGRITFVGAGPGDPGLLTRRAWDALTEADHIVYDIAVPEALLFAVRAAVEAAADPEHSPEFSPAEGIPGDVAKILLTTARAGRRAAHLVLGDPFGHDSVVKEVQAVARTSVPFEVVPGVGQASGVATYAGVPLGTAQTTVEAEDIGALNFDLLAAATKGGLAMAAEAASLGQIRDGLIGAGVDPNSPVAVTGDGTGETQYTASSTVDGLVESALGFTGRVVLTFGSGVTHRDKLGWWENRPLYG